MFLPWAPEALECSIASTVERRWAKAGELMGSVSVWECHLWSMGDGWEEEDDDEGGDGESR